MAFSVNKVIIVGNLGQDPDVRYTSSGKAVANFSVATSEGRGDEERTEWHRVVVWEKLAELCGQYLAKGRKVYVEGRIQTRKWTDRDGAERYATEIVARDVVFLGGKVEGEGKPSGGRGKEGSAGSGQAEVLDDDDVPF